MIKSKLYLLLCLALLAILSCEETKEVELYSGMIINKSVQIKKDTFYLKGGDSLTQPSIIIEGRDIVVDFNDALVVGSETFNQPHTFSGIGIEVRNGYNITIKNLRLRGYKIGLTAYQVDSLKIIDCDLSYNYRQKLKSTPEKEDLADWMSYHQNDQDQWMRYGMSVYLRQCDHALVDNLKVTGGQNGLMLSRCNNGMFRNNDLSFNSGLGIGMYRSSRNRIFNNKCDWNIRGYSHGVYNRGQDSAGILLYEQCSENIIAHNSATHSGDGFFLWAGQTTMDSGEGGCNGNLVYNNNFSYASNNGIEVTFSGDNIFYKNWMVECDYGLWGGYSYGMEILENTFKDNNHSIAIEHGNDNEIMFNEFLNDKIGIKLFERDKQPESWGFAKKRNVSSRNYAIGHNDFKNMNQPFLINRTDSLLIWNNVFRGTALDEIWGVGLNSAKLEDNYFVGNNEGRPIKSNQLKMENWANRTDALREIYSVVKNSKADVVMPEPDLSLRGRKYMIMDEFGPYNYKYPALWLRKVEGRTYTFVLFGPFGNWKAIGGSGFELMSQKRGSLPATLVLEAEEGAEQLEVELEFIGEAFVDAFGKEHPKGKPVKLIWSNE